MAPNVATKAETKYFERGVFATHVGLYPTGMIPQVRHFIIEVLRVLRLLNISEGGKTSGWLATLPDEGATGGFFHMQQRVPW
jgi:NmrA-like family